MKKEDFFNEIEAFIKSNSDGYIAAIDPNENLISSRIIDSFTLLSIILKVEELLPETIDMDNLKIEHISSLNSMYSYFVEQKI